MISYSNSRRDERFDTDQPVGIHGGDGNLEGSLRNVSMGGALVEFAPSLGKRDVAFDIGASVELHPQAAGSVRGTVVRYENGAIAVKFVEPEPDLLAQLFNVVRESLEQKR